MNVLWMMLITVYVKTNYHLNANNCSEDCLEGTECPKGRSEIYIRSRLTANYRCLFEKNHQSI